MPSPEALAEFAADSVACRATPTQIKQLRQQCFHEGVEARGVELWHRDALGLQAFDERGLNFSEMYLKNDSTSSESLYWLASMPLRSSSLDVQREE